MAAKFLMLVLGWCSAAGAAGDAALDAAKSIEAKALSDLKKAVGVVSADTDKLVGDTNDNSTLNTYTTLQGKVPDAVKSAGAKAKQQLKVAVMALLKAQDDQAAACKNAEGTLELVEDEAPLELKGGKKGGKGGNKGNKECSQSYLKSYQDAVDSAQADLDKVGAGSVFADLLNQWKEEHSSSLSANQASAKSAAAAYMTSCTDVHTAENAIGQDAESMEKELTDCQSQYDQLTHQIDQAAALDTSLLGTIVSDVQGREDAELANEKSKAALSKAAKDAQDQIAAAKKATKNAEATEKSRDDALKAADQAKDDFVAWANGLKNTLDDAKVNSTVDSVEATVQAQYDQDVAKAKADLNATREAFLKLEGGENNSAWKALFAKQQDEEAALSKLQSAEVLRSRMSAAAKGSGESYRTHAHSEDQSALNATTAFKSTVVAYKAAQAAVGVRSSISQGAYDNSMKHIGTLEADIAAALSSATSQIDSFEGQVSAAVDAKYPASTGIASILMGVPTSAEQQETSTSILWLAGVAAIAGGAMLAWARRRAVTIDQHPLLG
jgi:hypothetical protein